MRFSIDGEAGCALAGKVVWLVEGSNPAVGCLWLQCKGYLKAGLRFSAKPKIFQVAFAVGGLLGQMAHPIKLPQPIMPA